MGGLGLAQEGSVGLVCVWGGGPCMGGLGLAQEGRVPVVYSEVQVEQV